MFEPSEYGLYWSSILEGIRESGKLSSTALDFWFANVKIVYMDEETVVFSVENEIKQKTILSKYAEVLSDCTAAVTHLDSVEIEIIVEALPRKPLEGEGRVNSPLERAMQLRRLQEEEERQARLDDQAAREKIEAGGGERRLSYNSDYTFDNFIVGNSNKFAHAAALAVANQPAALYNPLFIYGPSGLGKTHLMYAITNKLFERNPNMNVIYINGEDFTNQLIEMIKRQKNAEFREKYRKADMLLIDDIQFIAGREATQEEFFHTFNALYNDKKQIILTSDRPPKDMVTLEERIRSRFEQGVIADIQQPDYELRLAILKNKAESMNLFIDDDMLSYIAEKLQSNIRQLEGIIKRILATHLLNGANVDMELVRSLVPMFQQETESVDVTVEKILNAVQTRHDVSRADIIGKDRQKPIANARNLAMYIIRQVLGLSNKSIGEIFGNRDHSTVISNLKAAERLIKSDPTVETEISDIRREIKK